MIKAKFYEQSGAENGTRELPASLFESEINESVLHQAVVAYRANQRQGSASTKERSDVRGGGRKPFRQKGTGRARAGTIRSPIHTGGGVVFGPHPRSYRQALPRKVRRQALRCALSSRAKDGDIIVVADLDYNEPKTKNFVQLLRQMDSYQKKVLFLLEKSSPILVKSARNIPGVKITLANMVTPYEVLWADRIIITQGGINVMEEVFKNE